MFAAGVAVWNAGGALRSKRLGRKQKRLASPPAFLSSPSFALRPRVAGRSPMSGASLAGDEGGRLRQQFGSRVTHLRLTRSCGVQSGIIPSGGTDGGIADQLGRPRSRRLGQFRRAAQARTRSRSPCRSRK